MRWLHMLKRCQQTSRRLGASAIKYVPAGPALLSNRGQATLAGRTRAAQLLALGHEWRAAHGGGAVANPAGGWTWRLISCTHGQVLTISTSTVASELLNAG